MNSYTQTIKNSLSVLHWGYFDYLDAPVVIHGDNENCLRRAREIYDTEARNTLLSILINLKIVSSKTYFEEIKISEIFSYFHAYENTPAINQKIIDCNNTADFDLSVQELDRLSKEISKSVVKFRQVN